MIDSVLNLLFRCPHKRITRPITPVSKAGVPQGDTYVVCLDCGKRFHYDWEQMRMGALFEDTIDTRLPKPTVGKRSVLRYLVAAITLPVFWLIGKAAFSRKRSKPEKEQNPET